MACRVNCMNTLISPKNNFTFLNGKQKKVYCLLYLLDNTVMGSLTDFSCFNDISILPCTVKGSLVLYLSFATICRCAPLENRVMLFYISSFQYEISNLI